jgi:hypothetical protein
VNLGESVVAVHRLSLWAGGLLVGPCDAAGAERFLRGGGTVAGVGVFAGIAEQLKGRRG